MMYLKFKGEGITKENFGVHKLIKEIAPDGKLHMDVKKKVVEMEDFREEKLEIILFIIKQYFDYETLDFNRGVKIKSKNDKKLSEQKRKKMEEEVAKGSDTTSISKVKKYILAHRVFSFEKMRRELPEVNYSTMRNYVSNLRKEGLIVKTDGYQFVLK